MFHCIVRKTPAFRLPSFSYLYRMSVLQINQLNKHYGRIHAVNNLSLTLNEGAVYGILGPNGSGKTTTLGIVLGITNPSSGSYEWFEGRYGDKARQHVGALLETPNFYPYLNAVDNLDIIAQIKGTDHKEIDHILELVHLADRKKSKFKNYSLGMKQRLAIAASLVGNPKVLIYDEPANGLDPQGIAEIRNVIQRIAGQGKTIFMSSHILAEIEKVCTDIAIIKNGKLLAEGPIGTIISRATTVELNSENNEKLKAVFSQSNMIQQVTEVDRFLVVQLEDGFHGGHLNQLAFQNDITLTHLFERKVKLEEEFLAITSKAK